MKYTKHLAIFLLVIGLLIPVGQSLLFAGITGKISGVVTDAETGQALPGANVLVDGTSLGAATDLEGYYTILNIPPGVYSIKVSMMGYTPVIIDNIRIRMDLTTNIDASLNSTVLETGESVTIVAQRELVQMDMTGSLSAVGADEIQDLPVNSVNQVLQLQAGVTQSNGEIHIRGGRGGEVAFWVDGVSTTDVYSGSMGVTVENSAVEELQVVSGTFNAEYGQAMSGIINIITKEGGEKWKGQLEGYVGDYISNGDEFAVLKEVQKVYDPSTGQAIDGIGIYENPLKKFNPNYNGEYTLSGPIPFTNNNLTLFTTGRYTSTEGHVYGRRWFTAQGLPGDSSLVPLSPYERYSWQGKLTYKLTSNIKLGYNVFWNRYNQDRINYVANNNNYRYNPDGLPKQSGGGTTHIFSFNHVLSPTTFYEVRVNHFYNEFERKLYDDPEATPDYYVVVAADEENGLPAETIYLTTEEGKTAFQEIKATRDWNIYVDPDGPLGYMSPDSLSAPTSYSYYNVGTYNDCQFRSTAYWVAKLDLTSQVARNHQVKTGMEYRTYQLIYDDYTLRPKQNETASGDAYPFQSVVPSKDNYYRDYYDQKPWDFSAYFQDKMEFHDIIMNIGLRFDYFDANASAFTDPEDPSIYNPFKDEHIYKNWVEAPVDLSPTELIEYKAGFDEYTPEERKAFMWKKVDAKYKVSPRLGLAYPITDKGVIHFSYGHFFQIPEFQYLYQNCGYKLSAGGGSFVFGNPDLSPQKTVQYEIGLQQQISDNVGVDVTVFYRDVRDWVGTSARVETVVPSVMYSQYVNKDYENVRGITFKLDRKYANNFSASVDYTFQVAEGTYTSPIDAFNSEVGNSEPRLNLIAMGFDQRHTANASFVSRFGKYTFSFIGRIWSGHPYTPTFAEGASVGGAALTGLKTNSENLPIQKNLDLYIKRRFNLDKIDLTLFMNVYNVFDFRDETSVYSDTGSASYTTSPGSDEPYNENRIGTVEAWVTRPDWYTTPRQVQAGIQIGF